MRLLHIISALLLALPLTLGEKIGITNFDDPRYAHSQLANAPDSPVNILGLPLCARRCWWHAIGYRWGAQRNGWKMQQDYIRKTARESCSDYDTNAFSNYAVPNGYSSWHFFPNLDPQRCICMSCGRKAQLRRNVDRIYAWARDVCGPSIALSEPGCWN